MTAARAKLLPGSRGLRLSPARAKAVGLKGAPCIAAGSGRLRSGCATAIWLEAAPCIDGGRGRIRSGYATAVRIGAAPRVRGGGLEEAPEAGPSAPELMQHALRGGCHPRGGLAGRRCRGRPRHGEKGGEAEGGGSLRERETDHGTAPFGRTLRRIVMTRPGGSPPLYSAAGEAVKSDRRLKPLQSICEARPQEALQWTTKQGLNVFSA